MSSAADRPAAPRMASRSRGRSSAGISRIARPAGRDSSMASLAAGGGREFPDPDDESPPIPSAIRIREQSEPYRATLTRRSPRVAPPLSAPGLD